MRVEGGKEVRDKMEVGIGADVAGVPEMDRGGRMISGLGKGGGVGGGGS